MSSVKLADVLSEYSINDMSHTALDSYIDNDFSRKNRLIESLIKVDPKELEENNLLIWADNRTCFADQSEILEDAIKEQFGDNYNSYVASKRIIYGLDCSRPLDDVLSLYSLFVEYKINIPNFYRLIYFFDDCLNIDKVKNKLNIYTRLLNGRLDDFLNERFFEKIQIIQLDNYKIYINRDFSENTGFSLDLKDEENNLLMYVSGKVYNKETTTINEIHGGEAPEDNPDDIKDKISRFKEDIGIHPANYTILMYLKLGQMLGDKKVKIRGHESNVHNKSKNKSKLYDIPRNYFKVKLNLESKMYEIDKDKRDAILDKFSDKNEKVEESFSKIVRYLKIDEV